MRPAKAQLPAVRLSPGPLSLSALALGAGTAIGLRTSTTLSAPGSLAIIYGILLAGVVGLAGGFALRAAPERTRWLPIILLLSASLSAGLLGGRRAGAVARTSCLRHLEPGDNVELRGRLASGLAGRQGEAAIDRSARFVVLHSIIRASAGTCRIKEVSVRARRPAKSLPAGAEIELSGQWLPYGQPGAWPTRPERRGFVRGSIGAGAAESTDGGLSISLPGLGILRSARAAAIDRVENRLPSDVAPAGVALLLAERGRLDGRTTRAFADAGLAHLLAISGLHVGILAAVALAGSGLFLVAGSRFLAAAALVIGYVSLIGAPPAAARAAVLFTGYAACRARGSPVRISELLAAAALIALVSDPLTLLDAGFQLSFAGFAGLLLGERIARRALSEASESPSVLWEEARKAVRSVLRMIGAGAGAFLLTAPIAAWHFYRIAPVSVFSGLLGSPLVALALVALLGVLLAPGPIAASFAAASTLLIRGLFSLVQAAAAIPLGHGAVGRPGALEWTLVGCLVSVLVLLASGRRFRRTFPLIGLGVGLILAFPALRARWESGRTLVCTLDVGQGDAAVVRTRSGSWIAVDAGPSFGGADAGRRVVLPFLLSNGARAIELFALTHPDLDHVGGAASLFDRLPVRRVLDSGLPVPTDRYREHLQRVAEEGAAWLVARPGSRLRVDEVDLLVLGPAASFEEAPQGGSSPLPIRANDASLTLRIGVGDGFAYVNAGDAPAAEEARMVELWPSDTLRADVLKVSHHGSKNSSNLRWLRAVGADLALISAGAGNRYGHPHLSTVDRLEAVGVRRIWRTDLEGTGCIAVEPDGGWSLIGA